MGRQPSFKPSISSMQRAIYETNGNKSAIARRFNVNRETVHEYFKRYPSVKKMLDDVHEYNTDNDLDLAEYVNRYNMSNFKENPSLAQRAAEKVLDKKGERRGWGAPISSDASMQEIDREDEFLKTQYELDKKEKEIKKLKEQLDALQSKTNPEL